MFVSSSLVMYRKVKYSFNPKLTSQIKKDNAVINLNVWHYFFKYTFNNISTNKIKIHWHCVKGTSWLRNRKRKTGRKLDTFHFLYTFSKHPLIIQFAINIPSSRSVSEGFSTQTTQKTVNTGNCLAWKQRQ